MASPGTDTEHLLARLTTVSVVLHGLLHRLVAKGRLAPDDVAEIEAFALDLARGLRDHGASGPQVAGARLEEDVRSFFAALAPDDGPDGGAGRV